MSSRLIVSVRENRSGREDLFASIIGRDLCTLNTPELEQVARIEAIGDGFVVTAYGGRLSDLSVDQDTRLRLTPVADLDLSVRSMNCLRFAGISTVGELCEHTETLLALPNMGVKSLSEIRERLSQLGLAEHQPGFKWKRTLDLRLLLRLTEIDPGLTSIMSQTPYGFVWEICAADLVALKNFFGKHALQKLTEAMERLGVPMSTVVPKWLPASAAPIRAAFAPEICAMAEGYREAPAEQYSPVIANGATSASTSLADEMDRFILAGVKPDYKPVISLRKGWDGGYGATLEEAGTACELTREGVRQIAKKLKPAMPAGGFQFLKKALDIVVKLAPCTTDSAETAVWDEFSEDLRLRVEGLLSAAEIVGLSLGWGLEVERIGAEKFVGTGADLELIRQIDRIARADVSHYGVGDLDRVCAGIPTITRETIAEHLRFSPHCFWDPADSAVFYLPTTRNAILSRLRRILSVISPVSAEVTRTQILRDRRMEGSEFSPEMLAGIANLQPWCRVIDDQISGEQVFDAEGEDSNEEKLVALLRKHGPVMDSRSLQKSALQVGISDVHFNTLLASSPLIVKHGRALYGLVGSALSPEMSSIIAYEPELQPLPTSDGSELDGMEGLASADAASPDFCLRAFAYMAKRARQLRRTDPWSIVEVFGSSAERGLLRRWGREGIADVKWLRSRSVSHEGEQIPARNALALLFLAYSAETVRSESSEGEMWRQIRQSLNASLATEFFHSNGNARPWLREATELVCRRLHVRHAFGQEGEQGWLRTVYLQFGMTKAGFKRLPYWLSGYGVPVAVEDLQDRSADLFSPTFAAVWEALGDYRIGARAEREVRKLLVSNPWAGPEFAEELLASAIQRREIVRASERTESESIPGAVSSLFLRPKLLWKDEPYFELSISPEPPPWLEASAYTLVVSDGQRIPIRRVDDMYEMVGVGSTLVISARLQSIGIDVLHRRVSVLPDKIEIDFRPKSDLAFYRLSDGRMFEPWDDLPKGPVPFAVLHRVHDRLEPATSEFSLVFAGEWQLSAYRQGMPSDLCLDSGQERVWQRAEPLADRKENEGVEARITCDGGKWGERKHFLVAGLPPNLRPVEAIIGTQICPLVSDDSGQIAGHVTLEPTNAGSAPSARLIAREGIRLRSLRASVDIGPVTGAAFDHLGAWVPLHGTEFFPLHKFRERLFSRPPSIWKGEALEERDWAILEGDRILDRPSRRGQMLIHSLFGLGEELRLAVNKRGEWWRGFKIVLGVVDTGLIRSAEKTDSAVTIELLRDIEIGQNHELWVWPTDAPEPAPLAREYWRVDDGRIVADIETGHTASIAIAFKGLWLGAISLGRDHSWLTFKGVIEQTTCWSVTAEWLRWFRVPILLPHLRSVAQMKAESDPAGTFLAWTCERPTDSRSSFSDEHRERWAQVIRAFLYFWRPTPEEATHVLGALGVLPSDPLEIIEAFESTREGWQNADVLARIDPGMFASLAISALPAAYPDARPEERAVLVKILRKQIMGTDQELSLEEFSWRIGLDRRFASAVLNAESLRRERSLSLRIALGDYSVRQLVCVRLLDEGMSQGLI